MAVEIPKKPKAQKRNGTTTSRHANVVPPRNPNRKPTNINMERSIAHMRAEHREVIRRAMQ